MSIWKIDWLISFWLSFRATQFLLINFGPFWDFLKRFLDFLNFQANVLLFLNSLVNWAKFGICSLFGLIYKTGKWLSCIQRLFLSIIFIISRLLITVFIFILSCRFLLLNWDKVDGFDRFEFDGLRFGIFNLIFVRNKLESHF